MFGVMQHLDVIICKNAEEAVEKGFMYRPPIKPVEIERVIVVMEGTENGKSSVDLLLKDEAGNQFVVMLTGNLWKSVPC